MIHLKALTAKLKEKRGDEFVEASIVLPIIILTILSLIMLIIYYYSCLNTQIELHKNMIANANQGEVVFKISTDSKATSSSIGGVISMIMNKDFQSSHYEINETLLIRLGEVISDD